MIERRQPFLRIVHRLRDTQFEKTGRIVGMLLHIGFQIRHSGISLLDVRLRKRAFAPSGIVIRSQLNITIPRGQRIVERPQIAKRNCQQFLNVRALRCNLSRVSEQPHRLLILLQIAINERKPIHHIHVLRLLPQRFFENISRPVVVPRMGRYYPKLIQQIEIRRIGSQRLC